MPRNRRFIQCDVFTSTPTRGNALAVVLDSEDLSDDAMAAFAAWTNLAETTFVMEPHDPSADYRLRIFTPQREMPFAGHPTLGSCASWLHAGGRPLDAKVVRQECGIGIVDIRTDCDVPAFVAPPTSIDEMPLNEKSRLALKLGLASETIVNSAILCNGPVWQVFELATAQAVLDVDSSRVKWPEEQAIGLIGPYPDGSECAFEVRMLAPSSGMSEDPITGSLNSALAHWLSSMERLNHTMVIAQGTRINRSGRVHVSRDQNDSSKILIGGHTHILIEGTIYL